jgi:hypothetical protein
MGSNYMRMMSTSSAHPNERSEKGETEGKQQEKLNEKIVSIELAEPQTNDGSCLLPPVSTSVIIDRPCGQAD